MYFIFWEVFRLHKKCIKYINYFNNTLINYNNQLKLYAAGQ